MKKEKDIKKNHFWIKLITLSGLFVIIAITIYLALPKQFNTSEINPSETINNQPPQVSKESTCYSEYYIVDLQIATQLKLANPTLDALESYVEKTGSNELRKNLFSLIEIYKNTPFSKKELLDQLTTIEETIYQPESPSSNAIITFLSRFMTIRKIQNSATNPHGIRGQLAQIRVFIEENKIQDALTISKNIQLNNADFLSLKNNLENLDSAQQIINNIYNLVSSSQYQDNFKMRCSDD